MAKNNSRRTKKDKGSQSKNVVYNTKFAMDRVHPITENQADAFDGFYDNKNLMLIGSAGTGKTFISLYLALEEVFKYDEIHKIIIVRSSVQTRDMGHQPGTKEEKMEPFESAYRNIVNKLIGRGDAYEILKKKGIIEFASTSFLRGDTYDNAIIIVDECQSMSFHELDTSITRIGEYSRVIYCGDTKQNDLIKSKYDVTGLPQFHSIIEELEEFETIEFGPQDIVRSGLVKNYILAKERALEEV